MASTTYYTGTLIEQSCGACGIVFGLPQDFRQARLNDHRSWFCPNGHDRHFTGQSEAERARAERDNALSRAQQLRNLLDDERNQHKRTENRLRSTRGVVTRTKRRIAAGACPRSHARFPDVKAHMETEHPDYGKDAQHLA